MAGSVCSAVVLAHHRPGWRRGTVLVRKLWPDLLVGFVLCVLALRERWGQVPRNGFFFDDAWVVAGAIYMRPRQLLVAGTSQPGLTLLLSAIHRVTGGVTWSMVLPALIVGSLGPALAYWALRSLAIRRSVALLAASPLIGAAIHVAYSVRPKAYVADFAGGLVLAAVLPRVGAHRWRWWTSVAWVTAMVALGSLSGYLTIVTAVATVGVVVMSRGDLPARIAALVTQGAVQGALFLGARDNADTAGIQQYQENAHDGRLEIGMNPIEVAHQLVIRLGRIAEVYPGGGTRLMQVVAVIAVAGLLASVAGWRAPDREVVAARFLAAVLGVAVAAAAADLVPFGNTTTDEFSRIGTSGGRHSLWLAPVILLGSATVLRRLVDLVLGILDRGPARSAARVSPARAAVVVDLLLVMAAVVVVAYRPAPLPYPHGNTKTIVQAALDQRKPGDALVVTGELIYIFPLYASPPAHLVATPSAQVSFTVEFDDPTITPVGHWSRTPLTLKEVERIARRNRPIVVLGAYMGPSDTSALTKALERHRYRRAATTVTGLYVTERWVPSG